MLPTVRRSKHLTRSVLPRKRFATYRYSDAEDEAMGGEVNEDDPAVKIENLYYNR